MIHPGWTITQEFGVLLKVLPVLFVPVEYHWARGVSVCQSKAIIYTFLGCTDTFQLNENQNAGGANQDTSASTESACKSVCLSRPYSQCAAYEFNFDNNECWIHTSKPDRLNSAQRINHYSRMQCDPGGKGKNHKNRKENDNN